MNKFDYKFENYSKALMRLKESLQIKNPDDLHVDGITQRFEFTFDLAWKAIKEYLKARGISCAMIGPRGTIKIALTEKLIYDGDTWIKMMESRNKMSHRYSYDESRKIYLDIKSTYVVLLENLCSKLKRGE